MQDWHVLGAITEAEEHAMTWGGGANLNGQPGIVDKFLKLYIAIHVQVCLYP